MIELCLFQTNVREEDQERLCQISTVPPRQPNPSLFKYKQNKRDVKRNERKKRGGEGSGGEDHTLRIFSCVTECQLSAVCGSNPKRLAILTKYCFLLLASFQ